MNNAQLTKRTKEKAVKSAILASGYQFQTVKFIKKDGTMRTMNGRLHVRKGVIGTGKAPSKAVQSGEQLIFWDRNAGFRTITLANVVSVSGMGKTRKFPIL